MKSGARLHLPRRQALLFLIAILVPCGVLLAVGWRLMAQERLLEEKRFADERKWFFERVQAELLSDLEKLKLHQATGKPAQDGGPDFRLLPKGAVAFVGLIEDGQLLLPWDHNPAARKFQDWLSGGVFANSMREAETLEFAAHKVQDAVARYRVIVDSSAEPAQRNYARLSLARALLNSGRGTEGEAEYQRVLASPHDLVDEHNVPLGFYAALPLIQNGANQEKVGEWIRFAADGEHFLPPAALGMARDLAVKTGALNDAAKLTDLIRDRDQAEALQRDFARVIPATRAHAAVWTGYGEPLWLTSVTAPGETSDRMLVAVRAGDVLEQLDASDLPIRVASVTDAAGVSVGEDFPGLRVVLPDTAKQSATSRQSFLAVGLVLAIMFTLLAGYLLWRDVQRDRRISEMRSQFVSSVSHELKTPLAAIRMFTETLRLDEEVDVRIRNEYLDTILHESERLSRLVDNVLDFGKIERGRKTYRFQSVQLRDVIEQAARAAQYPLEQAGFSLDISSQPDLPAIAADPDALQQAILNLLTNAMKYSGDSRRVGLSLDRKNGLVCIRVEDHGVGIAPEEQTRIFERFYRVPTKENTHIPGTGLGLTIVDHIAKAHGGGVEVVSSPGHGSAFTISLPVRKDG